MTRGGRLRKSAMAALFGWMTGLLATLPFQAIEVFRNSGHDPRLLIPAFGFGMAIWALCTCAGVTAAWFLLAMPIALAFSGEWLLRRMWLGVALSALGGALVAVFEFRIWTVFDHWPTDMTTFWLYLVFTASFGAGTCWCYVRLLAKVAPGPGEGYAQQR